MWSNSGLSEMFENGIITNGWLLGESGYPLRPWLLTPVLNPANRHEQGFSDAHMRTRTIVERSFGVLKSRFRCIDTSGGTLLYTPIDIGVAVIDLHNICITHRIPLPMDNDNYVDRGHIAGQHYNASVKLGFLFRLMF